MKTNNFDQGFEWPAASTHLYPEKGGNRLIRNTFNHSMKLNYAIIQKTTLFDIYWRENPKYRGIHSTILCTSR